ncbi:MAG: phosphatase PAP2 family protein [Gemmatimonadaceae bacterium]
MTTPAETPRWGWVAAGFLAAFGAATGFALWTRALGDWNNGLAWERSLLAALPRPLPPVLDQTVFWLAWLGTNVTLFPVLAVAGVWLWRARRRDLVVYIGVVAMGSLALNQLLKALFDRARPALWEHRGRYSQSSFPSGHAIAVIATLFTLAIILHRERGWRWPYAVCGVILVANIYSRLYLGVHWPSDVAGGAIAGVIWLVTTFVAFRPAAIV